MPIRFQNKGWANPVRPAKKTWLQQAGDTLGDVNKILSNINTGYVSYNSAKNDWNKKKQADWEAQIDAINPEAQAFEDMIINSTSGDVPMNEDNTLFDELEDLSYLNEYTLDDTQNEYEDMIARGEPEKVAILPARMPTPADELEDLSDLAEAEEAAFAEQFAQTEAQRAAELAAQQEAARLAQEQATTAVPGSPQ